jgi:hypothetical protein
MTCALIVLGVWLVACFVPIAMALDTREDERRRKAYEAEREAFYAKLRNERRP